MDFFRLNTRRRTFNIQKEMNNRSMQVGDNIYSAAEFRRTLKREMARVERSEMMFSLVVFNTNSQNNQKLLNLIHLLMNRIRITDMIGWLNDHDVAVFLPETPYEGAAKFAEDISFAISESQSPFHYRVYTYPVNDKRNRDGELRSLVDFGLAKNNTVFFRISSNGGHNGFKKSNVRSDHESNVHQLVPAANELKGIFHYSIPLWKRMTDIVGSLIAVVLFSPAFLIVSAYIKMVSRGPVLFKQERVGLKGKKFILWKFRTMEVNADVNTHKNHMVDILKNDAPMKKLDLIDDARIIPFGKILRQSCLDELPQLLNVLKGEMSLVGPRPCLAYEAEEFELWHKRRFDVLPGMTGYWQVNGKNKTTFKEMMRLDIDYVKNNSLMCDLKILLKTIPAIFELVLDGTLRKGRKSYA